MHENAVLKIPLRKVFMHSVRVVSTLVFYLNSAKTQSETVFNLLGTDLKICSRYWFCSHAEAQGPGEIILVDMAEQ